MSQRSVLWDRYRNIMEKKYGKWQNNLIRLQRVLDEIQSKCFYVEQKYFPSMVKHSKLWFNDFKMRKRQGKKESDFIIMAVRLLHSRSRDSNIVSMAVRCAVSLSKTLHFLSFSICCHIWRVEHLSTCTGSNFCCKFSASQNPTEKGNTLSCGELWDCSVLILEMSNSSCGIQETIQSKFKWWTCRQY